VNGQESLQMMRTLLEYGADSDAICDGLYYKPSMTPLLYAITQRSVEKVSLLLETADINRPARMGIRRTPLQLATELGDRIIIDLLLNRGADPNMDAAKFYGATALQLAAIKGFVGVAEMLLEKNANLFAPAAIHGGRMPFEGAAEHGRLDMMTFLVGKGVLDVEGGARQVQRAMDLAEKYGNVEAKNHAATIYSDYEVRGRTSQQFSSALSNVEPST
jgi:ankyrin repeat protein